MSKPGCFSSCSVIYCIFTLSLTLLESGLESFLFLSMKNNKAFFILVPIDETLLSADKDPFFKSSAVLDKSIVGLCSEADLGLA